MTFLSKNRTGLLLVFLATALLALCISGCGYDRSSKLKVRVGYFPNITHIQAVVGLSDGAFENSLGKNVQIEKKIFNAGPAEIEAFMSGKLDIGYIGPVPAINCFSKTKGGIKIIGGACNNGALLLTTVSSRIKSVSDLSGKKIAVPQFGNTQDIILRRFLKQNNLKTSDRGGTVKVIQSENANILTLLERGHIDAALVPEPWGSMIENRVKVNRLIDADNLFDGNKYSTTVIIASKKFMQEHPEILKKWMTTHEEITQSIKRDSPRYLELFMSEIKKLTGRSPVKKEIDSAMKNVDLDSDISAVSIQNYIDYMYGTKVISDKVSLDELLDKDYVN